MESVYTHKQVMQMIQNASGRKYNTAHVIRLVKAGTLKKVPSPENPRIGFYTAESVHKYVENLKEFYSKYQLVS